MKVAALHATPTRAFLTSLRNAASYTRKYADLSICCEQLSPAEIFKQNYCGITAITKHSLRVLVVAIGGRYQ